MNNLRTSPKFLQKPSPLFFMVHLLHRLYGVEAPVSNHHYLSELVSFCHHCLQSENVPDILSAWLLSTIMPWVIFEILKPTPSYIIDCFQFDIAHATHFDKTEIFYYIDLP